MSKTLADRARSEQLVQMALVSLTRENTRLKSQVALMTQELIHVRSVMHEQNAILEAQKRELQQRALIIAHIDEWYGIQDIADYLQFVGWKTV